MKSHVVAVFTLLMVSGILNFEGSLSAQSVQPSADSTGTRGLLRPGDVIRLKVWREPDWSGDFQVLETGVAVLPRLGPLKVTGMSGDALTKLVVDSLSTFLRNPSIQVDLLRRIRILGAVRNPGLYPVDPSVTVADALALAGGATSEGQVNKVVLRREGEKINVKLNKQARLADSAIQTGDELFVPEKGWVSRNTGLFAAGLSAATTLVVALILR
jgi:protein involved in polysaccharide export with SLBB domain